MLRAKTCKVANEYGASDSNNEIEKNNKYNRIEIFPQVSQLHNVSDQFGIVLIRRNVRV